ncbi:MAG: hypothetical protein ACN2B6_06610 [Rickettsiales bacterium]
MAGIYGGGNGNSDDRNRDGINDEFDRRPGNSGISEEYARKYDRRSEQEFTNRMETANQIEEARIRSEIDERNQNAFEDIKAAQSAVKFFPSVGKFIIPDENTWAAHAELVKDDETGLHFNPDRYVYFDKIVAERFGNPALYDPNHPDYASLEGLRTNLEVMRNDLIGMYLHDESFDPGDEIYIPKIAGIAAALGDALNNDKWWKRPFTTSIGVDVASVEGVGAREMYKFLLHKQDTAAKDTPLYNMISGALGIPNRSWQLEPLELTPYNSQALSAAPPIKKEQAAEIIQQQIAKTEDDIDLEIDRVVRSVSVARRLGTPELVDVPAHENAADEARTILRHLRNLSAADQSIEDWLDQGTFAERTARSEALSRLVENYGGQLKIAAEKTPGAVNSLVVRSANEAAGAMALAVAGHTLDSLPATNDRVITLEDALTNLPESWMARQDHSMNRLLDMLETGMEWATGQNVSDKSTADRLVEISDRIGANARKLQSVETMDAPARIESVELAREILRKLKGLDFADKDVEELIAPGSTNDNAALAQQLDEMIEIYRNLVSEAAQENPDIMNDERIRAANQSVGEFAHTVSLMAAKEIPASAAASQQISAEIANMPEAWKNLDGRTVNRLTQAMEAGVEQAVTEIQAQQEAQAKQNDEELAQQVSESSELDRHHHRRRKKKIKQVSSSLTKAAKRRNAGDMNGDGIADHLQGLNIKDDDLITLRQLSDNLRNASAQAAAVDVSAGNPLSGDDRSFAERTDPTRADRDKRNAKHTQI